MANINKDALVGNFILDEDVIASISEDNRDVIDYYVKKEKYENYISLPEIIWDITKNIFDEELRWENIDEIIYNIEQSNLSETIDWLIDIYDEDIINSYFYFDTDIDIEIVDTEDDIIISILKKAQFEWYSELFETIKNKFLTYLEWLYD